jgi:hypothetical protein
MAPDAKQARAAEVLALAKRLEVGRQEAPLPHVYFADPDITLSPLCLFGDPRGSLRSRACPALPARPTSASTARFSRHFRTWASDGRRSQASISSRVCAARSSATEADRLPIGHLRDRWL